MHGSLPFCLLACALLALSVSIAEARLWITEIVAENGLSYPGPGGDFPDWIEIYNSGGSPVELEGHYLTDDPKNLRKWIFPRASLGPGAFLVVLASHASPARISERRRSAERPRLLYASFQLKAKGEFVVLVAPDGETKLHQISFPRQHLDVSYGLPTAGRSPGDPARARPDFLIRPTPGEWNSRALDGFVRTVHFSEDHGFFEKPFSLNLETSTKDTVIRYTLDGSDPKAFTGREYTGPIEIDSTTILRARAFRSGYRHSSVATRTYLFLHDVVHQSPKGEPPPGWPYGRVEGPHHLGSSQSSIPWLNGQDARITMTRRPIVTPASCRFPGHSARGPNGQDARLTMDGQDARLTMTRRPIVKPASCRFARGSPDLARAEAPSHFHIHLPACPIVTPASCRSKGILPANRTGRVPV